MLMTVRSMILLLFLTLAFSGIDPLMLQTPLADSGDDPISSETRQEQCLRVAEARKVRTPGEKQSFVSRVDRRSLAKTAQASFTSLPPPHASPGSLHGLLQVFRI
jgi:hypothetical protein